MDNRVWYTRWHDARLTVRNHGVGMGTVHPIIEERLLRLALGLRLVAASHDKDRSRWMELVRKVAVHLGLVGFLVGHDEDLTTQAIHSMGVGEHTQKSL